jgi:hypothetical protein
MFKTLSTSFYLTYLFRYANVARCLAKRQGSAWVFSVPRSDACEDQRLTKERSDDELWMVLLGGSRCCREQAAPRWVTRAVVEAQA